MSTTNLTGELIMRKIYSETDNAIMTIPASSTTFSIELDAADGDNVLTKPDNAVISADGITSCVGMKTLCLYGSATTVEVSPLDSGAVWFTITPASATPMTICARRIQVTGLAGNIVIQAV